MGQVGVVGGLAQGVALGEGEGCAPQGREEGGGEVHGCAGEEVAHESTGGEWG